METKEFTKSCPTPSQLAKRAYAKERRQNFTEEERERERQRKRERYINRTEEEKERERQRKRERYKLLPPEKKEEILEKHRERYNKLSQEKKLKQMEDSYLSFEERKEKLNESLHLKKEKRKNPPHEKKEFSRLYDFCMGFSPISCPSLFFSKVLELTKVDPDFDLNFSKSDFSLWLKKNNIPV